MMNLVKATLTIASFFLIQACGEPNKSPIDQAVKSSDAFNAEGKAALVYTTASGTDLRLTVTDTAYFKAAQQPLEGNISIFVNPEKAFQGFIGIGGAITDASAEVFAKLAPEKQQELLRAYYDQQNGIGYTLARTNIHSCDFSSGSYTYVTEGDKALT